MSLFKELKKRKVIKLGVSYLVIAWLILQVADVIAPALYLPQSAITFVLYILAIGFPVTLLLSWAFELTEEGLRFEPSLGGKKIGRGAKALITAFVLLITIGGAWLASNIWTLDSENNTLELTEGPPALAVLPFQNLSSDSEQQYFVDGLSDEIRASLTHSTNLRVIARTSSAAFHNKGFDIPEIGKRLGVTHILEGTVQKQMNSVRVTVKLIKVSDGALAWSKRYEKTLDNVFALQDEISAAVASTINTSLLGTIYQEVESVSSITSNKNVSYTDTHKAVLQAKYLLGKLNSENNQETFDKIFALLDKALEQDPDFIPALLLKARTYNFAGSFTLGIMDMVEAGNIAVEAISRALSLDPENDEAWTVAGITYYQSPHISNELAIEAANKAISLNKNQAEAYAIKAQVLRLAGTAHYSEMIASAKAAILLDPFGVKSRRIYTHTLTLRGKYRDAYAEMSRWSDGAISEDHIQGYKALNAWFAGDLNVLHQLAQQMEKDNLVGRPWVRNRITEAYLTLGMLEKAKEWASPQSQPILAYADSDFTGAISIIKSYSELPKSVHRQYLDYSFDIHNLHIHMAGPAGDIELLEKELDDHFENRNATPSIFATTHYRYRPFGLLEVKEAWLQNSKGNKEAAKNYAQKGLNLLDEINATGLDRADYDYERARLYAQAGNIQAGLEALARAVRSGYRSWELSVDPYLENLRSDPKFKEIQSQHDAAVAEVREIILSQQL